MPLEPGTRLGPYAITAAIGAGGMGEVYQARDTGLNRDVALKVLPETLAGDPERLARFQREAESLAALNHPNIAQIYGVEDADGVRAIVMELVEGEDLSEVIGSTRSQDPALHASAGAAGLQRGGMPLDAALPIARQIADALEAAHERGIIHRDLKPANIKVKEDGTVKVLDFGLAKALGPDGPGATANGLSNSPTVTSPAMTEMGMILGTAAYMSPEQAKGKPVDKRADIWSFGVVLHEMLSGRPLFEGETVAETLGLIFAREPDLADLPPDTPRALKTVLRRCLEKDPRRRIRDMGDVRWHLDAEDGGGDDGAESNPGPLPPTAARPSWRTWGTAVVLAVAAAGTAWFVKPAAEVARVSLSIVLPPGEHVTSAPAISPDGTVVAYAAGRSPVSARLYLRALDGFEVRVVEGSSGAVHPFFSPDSQSVAFFADARLWRVPVAAGLPSSVVDAPAPWGGAWLSDDTIIYAPGLNSGLLRVAAAGGTPEQVTEPDGAGAGYAHVFPQAMPGRREVLFTLWGQPSYVAMLDPETGDWEEQRSSGEAARYAMSGHLLASDLGGGLSAWPFYPDSSGPAAPATLMLNDVYWAMGTDQAWADISTTGTLVYVPGSPTRRNLVWVDRDGVVDPLSSGAEPFVATAVSRDGRRVAHLAASSLRIQDLRTGAVARIPFPDTTSAWPGGWMPDGRLVISTNRDGDWDLFAVDTTGSGDWTPLLTTPHAQHPMDVSPSGVVVYLERHPESGSDLWTVTPEGEASPFAVGPFNQEEARFSPDERWVAYVSNDSGRKEVYVQPWPGPGDRVQVSVAGGTGPVWSPDGKELLYREDEFVMSVAVDLGDDVMFSDRVPILDLSDFESAYFHEFDMSADGERFLMIQSEPDARRTQVNVILNWFDELKRLAPGR